MEVAWLSIKKRSKGEHVFDFFNILFFIIFSLLCIYPFLYMLNVSISSGVAAEKYGLNIIPKGVTLEYYVKMFKTGAVVRGFFNSVERTALGTVLSVILTTCGAYPLSKKYLPNRNFWTTFVLIPMFFSGGLIPTYLVIRSLHIMDTIWVLVLPTAVLTFNLILVRNFMMSIPASLEESAKIDGANDIVILFRIILPVLKPILATIALWSAVLHWNQWFDALIYVTSEKKMVLQVVLYHILTMGAQRLAVGNVTDNIPYPQITKACIIVITTLPIIMVYPFAQKYFIKGIMIGSLKG